MTWVGRAAGVMVGAAASVGAVCVLARRVRVEMMRVRVKSMVVVGLRRLVCGRLWWFTVEMSGSDVLSWWI